MLQIPFFNDQGQVFEDELPAKMYLQIFCRIFVDCMCFNTHTQLYLSSAMLLTYESFGYDCSATAITKEKLFKVKGKL